MVAMHLARPGAYTMSVPAQQVRSTGLGDVTAVHQMLHFAHWEEPTHLCMWSGTRKEFVASHLSNVVEKGRPTEVNWRSEASWVHAQPLWLLAGYF